MAARRALSYRRPSVAASTRGCGSSVPSGPRTSPRSCNRLYIGTSAAAESLTLLRGLRIGGLVNCTENPNEPCADRVEAYLVIPVDDQPHINIGRHFDAAAEWLASQQQRSASLVYCGRGVSRSAAVVLAALMKLEGMTLLDAWLRLKRARPRVRRTRVSEVSRATPPAARFARPRLSAC